MPLITLRYSDNLNATKQLNACLPELNKITSETLKADLNVCKSALIPHENFCVGNGNSKTDAFIALTVELMVGRSDDLKKELSDNLLEALKENLSNIKEAFDCQISCHIKDLDAKHYYKDSV